MTRIDRLNVASDLKRIAYWLAVGDRTKIHLIRKFWENDYLKVTTFNNPEKAFNNKHKRLALAEELLLASIKLEHQ
ncbi:hypothetical protein A3E15_02780 [Candidatus Woesebacteria bacterium RIFCSPHIGHO2_12_FULL_42_9]|uniref:Uncharacterized protein n=2 Tax=Candidatus Woeseibacteriota TaxID=1752722 RepID=A0A1F8ARW3_9BACT|nr:MAG: hypothetical protein A2112_00285 [Candidatus Woesebacteria bacterium GWA1_42_12]OGM54249.1 MAG: hypothetical protein A3E15_02780 [Candidatus Woesebacteria bacterium RIFCSPHIGHO2_12_FULL_42_9]